MSRYLYPTGITSSSTVCGCARCLLWLASIEGGGMDQHVMVQPSRLLTGYGQQPTFIDDANPQGWAWLRETIPVTLDINRRNFVICC